MSVFTPLAKAGILEASLQTIKVESDYGIERLKLLAAEYREDILTLTFKNEDGEKFVVTVNARTGSVDK